MNVGRSWIPLFSAFALFLFLSLSTLLSPSRLVFSSLFPNGYESSLKPISMAGIAKGMLLFVSGYISVSGTTIEWIGSAVQH